MKMRNGITWLALVMATVISASSFAGIITDTVSQKVKLSTWDTHTYQHNLLDDGFVMGSALAGHLSIEVWDDGDFWPELALFKVDKFDLDTGTFTFGTNLMTDLEVKALGVINATGMLDITVVSLFGDFYVGKSILTVKTDDNYTPPSVTVSVPEPGSLLLLGLGIAALGYSRRLSK